MSFSDPKRMAFLGRVLSPARKIRIVDVGANPLEPAPYEALLKADLAEVWAFEPHQAAFEALKSQIGPNMHLLPYAVGDGQRGTLHVCQASGFTSLLPPNPRFLSYLNRWHRMMRVVEKVEVETRRLDDMEDVPQIDFLKIDIQGGELAVFENGGAKLSDVLGVISEVAAVPLYENQPLLDDQMRAMRGLGLDLHKFLFFKSMPLNHGSTAAVHPQAIKNQLVDGDAVFLRDLLGLEDLESERLKFMVLLADGVFESFDLALHILHLLEKRGEVPSDEIAAYVAHLPDSLISPGAAMRMRA